MKTTPRLPRKVKRLVTGDLRLMSYDVRKHQSKCNYCAQNKLSTTRTIRNLLCRKLKLCTRRTAQKPLLNEVQRKCRLTSTASGQWTTRRNCRLTLF